MKLAGTAAAIASILFALTAPAGADTLTFSLTQAYTRNLFQTQASVADRITLAGLSWEKSLSSFSVFASADAALLWENSGLSDLDFSGGVDYVAALGSKTALYFALEGGIVRYRSEYADFGRSGARLTASLKTYLSPSSIFKATSATEYRVYGFSPFDFLSHGLTASLDKYFPSKTTLKAEAAWGFKYFLHPWLSAAAAPTAEAGAEETILFIPPDLPSPDEDGPPGKKPGMPGNGAPGQGNQGSGSGGSDGALGNGPNSPGPGGKGALGASWRLSRGTGYAYADGGGSQGIQMASGSLILAQGLGNRVGLRLAGILQKTLSGQNPFSAVEEFAMIENPTYDAFAWQGWGWNAQATAILPWNIELRLGYTWTDKEFPGIESLDLEGVALGLTRRDERDQIDVSLEKSFKRWSAVLSYGHIRNRSNDPLYAWSGPFVSLGLRWSPPIGEKQ